MGLEDRLCPVLGIPEAGLEFCHILGISWKLGVGEYAGHWALYANEPGPRHRARQKSGFGA